MLTLIFLIEITGDLLDTSLKVLQSKRKWNSRVGEVEGEFRTGVVTTRSVYC